MRHVPATVHELSRIGLLAGLPGEQLNKLAGRMAREDVPAGAGAVVASCDRATFDELLRPLFADENGE